MDSRVKRRNHGVIVALIAVASCRLLTAQNPPHFPATPSPGAAVEDAARSSVKHLPGAVDILTDTRGVDFAPYLQRVMADIRQNWYSRIPDSAMMKKGKVAIEVDIEKDGHVSGVKLVATSADRSLDRAAWDGIEASNPFPPLPTEFSGPMLGLRIRFYYNLAADDSETFVLGTYPPPDLQHAILIQHVADGNPPEYPKKAIQAKIDGIVRLEAEVKSDGKVGMVTALEGDPLLADASMRAIRRWQFEPAVRDGKKVEDKVGIKVEFRLEGDRVKTQIVRPESATSK